MRHHWIKIEVVDRRADDAADGRAWARREGGNGGGGQDTRRAATAKWTHTIFYLSTLIISLFAVALFPTQSSEHPVAPWQRPEGRAASPLRRAVPFLPTRLSFRHPVVPRGAEVAE